MPYLRREIGGVRMSILIVEDDTAQARYLEALLTRMGVQIRWSAHFFSPGIGVF